jgi:hypothetical protein
MADADAPVQAPANDDAANASQANAAGDQATAVAAAEGDALPEVQHPPAKPWIPDHLQRLLSLLTEQQQQQQPQPGVSQAQLLVLTVHAAMLESGFQPFASLPPAAAAAGPGDTAGSSSSGADLSQRQQQLMMLVLQGKHGLHTLAYQLPGGTTQTAAVAGSSSSSHDAAAGVFIEVKAVDVGHHLVLAGSLKTAAAAGASGSAGTGAASSGSGSSSSSKSSSKLVLSLSIPKSHIILLQSSTPGADSAGAAHAAAGTAAAADTAAAASADKQNAQADPGTSSIQQQQQERQQENQQQQQQPGWPLCSYAGLQQLWVLLKDRLCLPLLVAGCAAAGLAAPVGLASLPYEMQEAVLALLAVSVVWRVYGSIHVAQVGGMCVA